MNKTERLILGIDPGYGRMGYAVIATKSTDLRLLVCNAVSTPAKIAYPARLQRLYEELSIIVSRYQPREAAMEKLFFGKNAPTAIAVAQARGIALLALAQHGSSIAEYTLGEVKLAVTGYGAARKAQVGEMVRLLLHLSAIPRPDDAADAHMLRVNGGPASTERVTPG